MSPDILKTLVLDMKTLPDEGKNICQLSELRYETPLIERNWRKDTVILTVKCWIGWLPKKQIDHFDRIYKYLYLTYFSTLSNLMSQLMDYYFSIPSTSNPKKAKGNCFMWLLALLHGSSIMFMFWREAGRKLSDMFTFIRRHFYKKAIEGPPVPHP